MSSDECEFFSCSEGEEYPPPPTPAEVAAYAMRRQGRPRGCRAGRCVQAARAAAVARASMFGHKSAPQVSAHHQEVVTSSPRLQAAVETSSRLRDWVKRCWLGEDLLHQRHAARHSDQPPPPPSSSRPCPGRPVNFTGAG